MRLEQENKKLIVRLECLCLLEIYTLVLIASYIEWFAQGIVSYALSVAIGAVVLIGINVILKKKIRIDTGKIGSSDWVVFGALALFYVVRLAFADISWDTNNYHIYAQESMLRDPVDFDFFPTRPVNYNALFLADLIFRPFREVLGYRLGTVITPLIMMISYIQVKRIMRLLGVNWSEAITAAAAGIAVCTDVCLMIMGSYYTDTLSIPLILEALICLFGEKKLPKKETIWLGYVAGMAVALKISNAYLAIGLAIIWLVMVWKNIRWTTIVWTALLAIVPMCVFMIRGFVYTGNPLFPYANALFETPYFPTDVTVNQWVQFDVRFGPENIWQTIAWPFYILDNPGKMSDEVYTSGRLSIAYIVMYLSLIGAAVKKNKKQLLFSGIYCFFYIVYITAFEGYLRYIAVLDIMGVVMLAQFVASIDKSHIKAPIGVWLAKAVSTVLVGAIVLQTAHMVIDNLYYYRETGYRPTVFTERDNWLEYIKLVGKDIDTEADNDSVEEIDVWLVPDNVSSIPLMIDSSKPLWGIGYHNATTNEMVAYQTERLNQAREDGVVMGCVSHTWAQERSSVATINNLNNLGFRVVNATPIHVNFVNGFDPMALECEWVGEYVYNPAYILGTDAYVDLSGRDNATLAICMNGDNSQWENEITYSYAVDLLDCEGNVVEVMDGFELAYQDESVHLNITNIAGRGITAVHIYPIDGYVEGSLLIIMDV